MPIFNRFLCCLDLRLGVLLASGFMLVNDLILLCPHDEYTGMSTVAPGSKLFVIMDMALVGAGFYGALKNKITYVKLFAVYQWFRIAMNLLLVAIFCTLVAVERPTLIDKCEEYAEKHPDNTVDCKKIVTATIWGAIIGCAIFSSIMMYFGLCYWSYYQDLRDSPEKYGVDTVRRVVFLPLVLDNSDVEAQRCGHPNFKEQLPSYGTAIAAGPSTSMPNDAGECEGDTLLDGKK
ncbi:hypothetical protein HDU85_000695 [Gaertneriomyces sp. JEL0708]|nr:hypothetical protein HDU85_000695 [Gaertneriomyces sp. JEL0708]